MIQGSRGNVEQRADGDVGAPGVGAPEWYSRGYLPHRERKGLLQTITFRLADSLPQEKLREMQKELSLFPADRQDAERRKKIECWLDSGMGCCALRYPVVAQQVQDSLLHFHGERYTLVAWCIMPNHVHVLMNSMAPASQIVQGWKSFTARWALARNEALKLGIPDTKHLWQREYWDRYIRDSEHFNSVVDYIHQNPVKAGLCERAENWPWSSAGNANVLVGLSNHSNYNNLADGAVGAPDYEF